MTPSWVKKHGGTSLELRLNQSIWHFRGHARFFKSRKTGEWSAQAGLVWLRPDSVAFNREDCCDEDINLGGDDSDLPNGAWQIFDEWFWRSVAAAVAKREKMREWEAEWRKWKPEERARQREYYERMMASGQRYHMEALRACGLQTPIHGLPD